jgi:aminobenzoyl-glutamate transport protein
MLAGWFVTDRIVEPRLLRQSPIASVDTSATTDMALKPIEKRGLLWAGVVAAVLMAAFASAVLIPGAPLYGSGQPTLASGAPAPGERAGDRWSQVIVPMIFLLFLLPGMAFGFATGTLRKQADFVDAIYHGIRTIVPVLAIAFFMGQFVNYFQYTGLDRMLAYTGGSLLVQANLPVPLLIVLFVVLVVLGDFVMSGMLSKFGVLAPIFIPMFMMVGMSPELTTAAYRIGDSVVNIITPLNSYLLIILVVLQKYKQDAGLGTLISLMLPYSITFGLLWTAFLLLWYYTGLPLGTDAPLRYVPGM